MINQVAVSVIGAGYVGLTTAILLAESGYKTYLIEIDPSRLKTINSGYSFFYEAGIDLLLKNSLKSQRLVPTNVYDIAIPDSDFVFSCVGTPDNPDGSSNLTYVFSAAEKAAKLMKKGSIFVQKSTVPVGTGRRIEQLFAKHGHNFAYVSNPEFLREGTAVLDSLLPDRIVVGSSNKSAAKKVVELYKSISKCRNAIAAGAGLKINGMHKTGLFITNRNSAELIKVTSNAFLALKISFANSIAKLADQTEADITEVMNAVGADKRIGRAFLNAGRGYGGGCFPKDVSGLISSAAAHGVELSIMTSVSELNDSMPGYIANKVRRKLGSLDNKKLAVLGLSFKPGTSDARRSPGVKLANILAKSGARVTTYDPQAGVEARPDLRRKIIVSTSIQSAVRGADAIFLATDWPELIQMDFKKIKRIMRGNLIIDCMNAINEKPISSIGLEYIGVGR